MAETIIEYRISPSVLNTWLRHTFGWDENTGRGNFVMEVSALNYRPKLLWMLLRWTEMSNDGRCAREADVDLSQPIFNNGQDWWKVTASRRIEQVCH